MGKEASPKTDAMRALREKQFKERQERAVGKTANFGRKVEVTVENPEAVPPNRVHDPTLEPRTPRSSSVKPSKVKSNKKDVDEGTCQGCGKLRGVRNGKVASHQKGLGKQCPGAGKPPK